MADHNIFRWGIMGPGIIAHRLADALQAHPDCEFYAAASKNQTKAEKFVTKWGGKAALSYQELAENEEIDIVYVATTHNFHYENAKLALENGKHVLMEKPFTVNAQQARELVEIAKAKKLFLMEAIWVRFLPILRKLRSILLNGEIGEYKLIDISFGGFVYPDFEHRLSSPDLAGGTTLDMGIYPISVACYLRDETPSEIKSMARFSESGVDEIASYLFRFPSGCFATIKTSYNLLMNREAIIYGSEGIIEFPNFPVGDWFVVHRHNGINEIRDTKEIVEEHHDNGFFYQVDETVRCIHDGKLESEIISWDETVAIMDVMDQMRAEWGFKYPFE